MSDIRIYMSSDSTLEETLNNVHCRLKLNGVVPEERCRLIAYDHLEENPYSSFDGKDTELLRDLMDLPIRCELFFEIRDENSVFEPIAPDSIQTKVYSVDINTADIDGPISMRVQQNLTVAEYKKLLAAKLGWNAEEIVLAVLKYSSHATLLEIDIATLKQEDVKY